MFWIQFPNCYVQEQCSVKLLNPDAIFGSRESINEFRKKILEKTDLSKFSVTRKNKCKKKPDILDFVKFVFNHKRRILVKVEIYQDQMVFKWYKSILCDETRVVINSKSEGYELKKSDSLHLQILNILVIYGFLLSGSEEPWKFHFPRRFICFLFPDSNTRNFI